MKIGIKSGARLSAALAIFNAERVLEGLAPHDLGHIIFFKIWIDAAEIGKLSVCFKLDFERQSAKPGPVGRKVEKIARRSGGKMKLNSASSLANSASVRPGRNLTLELMRWVLTVVHKSVKDCGVVWESVGVIAAVHGADALAERRRRPAT